MVTPPHCRVQRKVDIGVFSCGPVNQVRTSGGTPLEHQLAAGIPATSVMQLAAVAAGQPLASLPIGHRQAAAGTGGDPGPGCRWQRIAVAQAHLELALGRIDGGHPRPKQGSMHLAPPQHPVDPSVDHLVAEGAERGGSGQGLQQRPRQHNFAEEAAITAAAVAVKTSGADHPPIAPAQLNQGLPGRAEAALEMLPIEAVEQRQ
jgi:hypothetical protein